MSMRSLLTLLVLILLGVFVAANWTAFTAPTSLSLLVATVQAPLGIVMLGVVAVIAAMFFTYAFYLQSSATREARRLTREIEAQRELADRAEASRLTELRNSLESRLDRLGGACSALQQSVSGVAAEVAELNDRMRPGTTTPSTAVKPVEATPVR